MSGEFDDLGVLEEMLREGEDPELQKEFEARAAKLRGVLEHNQLLILLNGDYDDANAILTVHAGSGGLDSQDWAEMLLRMYLRWTEREGLKATVLEAVSDEEAGIKSATVLVEGDHAYGFLKAEKGVHRLVRISPFDSAHRRHTSFSSVGVSPEMPENADVEVKPEDLRVDTFRASGAGGQYVNRTDSAVRITHLPTGIVVSMQNEKSQLQNREAGMRVLRARLLAKQQEERDAAASDARRSQIRGMDRSERIRTYNFPENRIADHRTGYKAYNLDQVMDGALAPIIDSAIQADEEARLAALADG